MISGVLVTIVALLFALIGGPLVLWYIFWEMSFTYPVWIARQAGKNIDDVIWFQDKCKVRNKQGVHTIIFRRQISKSQSFTGDLWSRFFKKKGVKFDDKKWKSLNMTKHLQRGLFLYQTSEGEFHPMKVAQKNEEVEMRILTQDNRMFLMNQTIEANELTLSKRQQMMVYGAIIVAFIALAVVFVLFLIYLNERAGEMCMNVVQNTGNQFLETTQGAVGG